MMTQRDIFVSRQSSGYTRPLFIRPYVEVLCLCLEAEKWTTRLLMRIFDGRESLYGFPCRQIKFASLVPQTSMTYWSDLVRLSFWAGARSVHPVWLTTATLDLLYLLSSLVSLSCESCGNTFCSTALPKTAISEGLQVQRRKKLSEITNMKSTKSADSSPSQQTKQLPTEPKRAASSLSWAGRRF